MFLQKKQDNCNSLKSENKQKITATIITAIVIVGTLGALSFVVIEKPKVSTCYYHFNIQYKAGDESTYDEIIYSMAHIIWMYGNHSTWNYTIETQFMTIEYMHDNFPEIFGELQRQNQAGQLELITPQYSDQWHIGYPLRNFDESVNYTVQRMNEWGLIQSKLILLQEGQWIPGFGQLKDNGEFEAAIVHREQLGYFNYYPEEPVLEWTYKGQTKYVIVNPRMPRTEAEMYHFQIYAADGELINTGDVEVDVGPATRFAFNEEKQNNHEQHLIQLEQKGNSFMRLDDFFHHCVENGAVGKMDKFIPELEWVPNQYEQFFQWMGNGKGETDDGTFLSRVYYATNYVQATELLLNQTYQENIVSSEQYALWGTNRINGVDGLLLNASKKVWEAQVSDTTGITPAYYEFWYGMNRTYEAIQLCNEVIANIRNIPVTGGNPYQNQIQINPMTQSIALQSKDFMNLTVTASTTLETIETEFDLNIKVSQSDFFENDLSLPYQSSFAKCNFTTNSGELEMYRLQWDFEGKYNISYSHVENNYISEEEREAFDYSTNTDGNEIIISFEDDWQTAIYSPALLENETQLVNREDYYTHPYGATYEWYCLLSLCNGMIYNPAKGYAIVKNITVNHLPGNLRTDSIEFRETEVKYHSYREYFLIKGELNEILQFANQINTFAPVNLEEAS